MVIIDLMQDGCQNAMGGKNRNWQLELALRIAAGALRSLSAKGVKQLNGLRAKSPSLLGKNHFVKKLNTPAGSCPPEKCHPAAYSVAKYSFHEGENIVISGKVMENVLPSLILLTGKIGGQTPCC
jgi:hypothetical protein